jgi:hypothetical protein
MQETFEDAPDTTPRPAPRDRARSGSPASVRSLTRRTPSQSSGRAAEKLRQSTGTPVVPEGEEEGDNSPKTRAETNGVAKDSKNATRSANPMSDGEMDDVNLAEGE